MREVNRDHDLSFLNYNFFSLDTLIEVMNREEEKTSFFFSFSSRKAFFLFQEIVFSFFSFFFLPLVNLIAIRGRKKKM